MLAYGWQLPIARSVMTQGTLQEFRTAEEKLLVAPGANDDENDWSKQKRSSKKSSRDMKKTIEDGHLWTGDK